MSHSGNAVLVPQSNIITLQTHKESHLCFTPPTCRVIQTEFDLQRSLSDGKAWISLARNQPQLTLLQEGTLGTGEFGDGQRLQYSGEPRLQRHKARRIMSKPLPRPWCVTKSKSQPSFRRRGTKFP